MISDTLPERSNTLVCIGPMLPMEALKRELGSDRRPSPLEILEQAYMDRILRWRWLEEQKAKRESIKANIAIVVLFMVVYLTFTR